VVHLWDAPAIVKEYLATGDEKMRDAAWRAANAARGDAAWAAAVAAGAAPRIAPWPAAADAAWGAASAATMALAADAARAAASAATRAAAADAAGDEADAAWDAAWDAAVAAQRRDLLRRVEAAFADVEGSTKHRESGEGRTHAVSA